MVYSSNSDRKRIEVLRRAGSQWLLPEKDLQEVESKEVDSWVLQEQSSFNIRFGRRTPGMECRRLAPFTL